VSYLQYIYDHDFVYQKEGNCIIPTICLFSVLCITKRETVSYLQYVYVLDFVYQKEGNCIIPTVCLCSRFCGSERRKLYHTNNMFRVSPSF
jgi:hypothetical protein